MINNKAVLITRPNDDPILNFLYFWTEELVKEAQKRQYNLLDLKGSKSNKKDLESYINKNSPGLILFNGHGTRSSICGYNNEPIVVIVRRNWVSNVRRRPLLDMSGTLFFILIGVIFHTQ